MMTAPLENNQFMSNPCYVSGSMGYVRYSLVADIEYQGIFGGKSKATASFTVLDAVDLNTIGSSRVS